MRGGARNRNLALGIKQELQDFACWLVYPAVRSFRLWKLGRQNAVLCDRIREARLQNAVLRDRFITLSNQILDVTEENRILRLRQREVGIFDLPGRDVSKPVSDVVDHIISSANEPEQQPAPRENDEN